MLHVLHGSLCLLPPRCDAVPLVQIRVSSINHIMPVLALVVRSSCKCLSLSRSNVSFVWCWAFCSKHSAENECRRLGRACIQPAIKESALHCWFYWVFHAWYRNNIWWLFRCVWSLVAQCTDDNLLSAELSVIELVRGWIAQSFGCTHLIKFSWNPAKNVSQSVLQSDTLGAAFPIPSSVLCKHALLAAFGSIPSQHALGWLPQKAVHCSGGSPSLSWLISVKPLANYHLVDPWYA